MYSYRAGLSVLLSFLFSFFSAKCEAVAHLKGRAWKDVSPIWLHGVWPTTVSTERACSQYLCALVWVVKLLCDTGFLNIGKLLEQFSIASASFSYLLEMSNRRAVWGGHLIKTILAFNVLLKTDRWPCCLLQETAENKQITRWAGQSPTWGRPSPQVRMQRQCR